MQQDTDAINTITTFGQSTGMFQQFRGRHAMDPSPHAEATELVAYPTHGDPKLSPDPVRKNGTRLAPITTFWRKEISFLVEARARRDHLANERTFLAWFRNSMALSMLGIFCAQIFTLHAAHPPDINLGFLVLGVPLGSLCQAAALVNILVGAHRFWRHQRALVNGKACSGGWEILFIGWLTALIILAFFILLLLSDSDRNGT